MRSDIDPVLSNGRIMFGDYGTTDADGLNGAFVVSPYGRELHVIASDGSGWKNSGLGGEPWEHVSVSTVPNPKTKTTPTWEEMDFVKDLFWKSTELVLQFHVPKKDHINIHDCVLHLWRPTQTQVILPPKICV